MVVKVGSEYRGPFLDVAPVVLYWMTSQKRWGDSLRTGKSLVSTYLFIPTYLENPGSNNENVRNGCNKCNGNVLHWATRSAWTLNSTCSRFLTTSSEVYFFRLIQWQVSSHIFYSVLGLQLKYIHLFQMGSMLLQDCLIWKPEKWNKHRRGRAEKQGRKEKIVILKPFKVSQSEDLVQICEAAERRWRPIPSFNTVETVWTRNTVSHSPPSLLCPAGHLGWLEQISDRIQFLPSFM